GEPRLARPAPAEPREGCGEAREAKGARGFEIVELSRQANRVMRPAAAHERARERRRVESVEGDHGLGEQPRHAAKRARELASGEAACERASDGVLHEEKGAPEPCRRIAREADARRGKAE